MRYIASSRRLSLRHPRLSFNPPIVIGAPNFYASNDSLPGSSRRRGLRLLRRGYLIYLSQEEKLKG
ncbi:MAG: hypothetical protein RMJ66_06195 [Bacteroidia bacterium]|nr:hypothetical protein [Bacteroidia bacterium]MDW8134642.1 hypothetical protein [Bacteroidia bacterium]